jgi:hypothetical protein
MTSFDEEIIIIDFDNRPIQLVTWHQFQFDQNDQYCKIVTKLGFKAEKEGSFWSLLLLLVKFLAHD